MNERIDQTTRLIKFMRSAAHQAKIKPLSVILDDFFELMFDEELAIAEREVKILHELRSITSRFEAIASRLRNPWKIKSAEDLLAVLHEEIPDLITIWENYTPFRYALESLANVCRSMSLTLFATTNRIKAKELVRRLQLEIKAILTQKHTSLVAVNEVIKLANELGDLTILVASAEGVNLNNMPYYSRFTERLLTVEVDSMFITDGSLSKLKVFGMASGPSDGLS